MGHPMKIFLIFLAIIFQCFFIDISWSKSKLGIGEKAYVWAKNGIWLREEPAIDAKKIEKLSYGTPLNILSDPEGSYESVVIYGQQGRTAKYSIAGAWRRVKVENTDNDNKEGYLFDGWLLSLSPLKCEINAQASAEKSKQSCEDIVDWCARNFHLVNKKKISLNNPECNDCGTTRFVFGKGLIYDKHEPGYGSSEELTLPGFNLSEGTIAALGLFEWWDGEKPRISLSEKRVSFFGTYQTLIVELNKKGVKIIDSCRDC
jgi:hypothetical protein